MTWWCLIVSVTLLYLTYEPTLALKENVVKHFFSLLKIQKKIATNYNKAQSSKTTTL
ncbi:hypothetical protein BN1423_260020 [Carnobacterium maltaromaticum]|nr:hypothetical protein CM318V1_440161 [Carnobacterium maltaromaticum]CRH22216.1 hypothetical protein BN1423_260020 [Carnobacterium maltaromaticum]